MNVFDPTSAERAQAVALPHGVFRRALTETYGANDDGHDLSGRQLRKVLAQAELIMADRKIALGLAFLELRANLGHVTF